MKPENLKNWSVIVLAAGQGKRMGSPLPKVLHPVAGRPMILRTIEQLQATGFTDIRVVIGHGAKLVKAVLEPLGGVSLFFQSEQRGTAHAVSCGINEFIREKILILNGDHPLISSDDFSHMILAHRQNQTPVTLCTAKVKNPGSLGRIVRQHGRFYSVVEAKDASAETLKINEINTGIYLTDKDLLADYLPKIKPTNAQNEFYLTDLLSLAREGEHEISLLEVPRRVAFGVNSQRELAHATSFLFKKKNGELMDQGVLLLDPRSTFVEETVQIAAGTVLYPQVFLRGTTSIGSFSAVEQNCFIVDSTIGDSVQIRANSYIEKAKIQARASVGPFARLRPETTIGEEAHVGNFVEMKKVNFGKKSKAGHLTYLGDAEIGEGVNIGCGTITCNYAPDKNKYKTVIGDRVFVGSDTQFVAPVSIGADAIIGSGSTITKDVPAKALALTRPKLIQKENYKPERLTEAAPLKKALSDEAEKEK